jgi:hypothetical protein
LGTFQVERESRPRVAQVDEGSCDFRVSGSLGNLQAVKRVIATFFGIAGHGSYPSFAGGARCCALSATDACGYTLSVMGYGALFGTQ